MENFTESLDDHSELLGDILLDIEEQIEPEPVFTASELKYKRNKPILFMQIGFISLLVLLKYFS